MIEVLYQDDSLVIAVKPADLLSVPGRGPENQDCLLHRLQSEFPTARIVHRLDCATSGVMVLALDADSHRELSRQFHDRETRKRYIAVVDGTLKQHQGRVELPLRCDWPNRPKQMVDHDQGKPALTEYRLLDQADDRSRVELIPITGRSHQLRVHMQALGHPILGDRFYATPSALAKADRLNLHAEQLGIRHPVSGERMEFTAPCPF
ncbi:RluA family pseudouridine synthase [Motiliproteus coralliicola]|uniref:Pseudouridine synthase n=1 Tax=Motiliproteus coralliicola TaxID=2283196 RepID=A0A369WRJ6_9GAMM|nr:RluA family pseudouridine synthase [Motiliproteus coralliicola]RDE24287.1 RluA family pseudouridine synthase [Motiliproteus coralliicola]